MYCGEMESKNFILAWHPSTLAHLSNISSKLPKKVPLGPMYGSDDTSLQ
jgi:hypothetical protein